MFKNLSTGIFIAMCLFLVSLQYFVQASHLCFAQKGASTTIHSFGSMKQAGNLYLKLFQRHHISKASMFILYNTAMFDPLFLGTFIPQI